jgi:hypothetical protein
MDTCTRATNTMVADNGSMTNTCSAVDDCTNAATRPNGWCHKHYYRWRTHGDVNTVIPFNHRANIYRVDETTYKNAHRRVRNLNGPAKDQACVDCGGPAAHWSYNLNSPREQVAPAGYRYSSDPSDYSARCVSCHWKLDGRISNIGEHQWRGGWTP